MWFLLSAVSIFRGLEMRFSERSSAVWMSAVPLMLGNQAAGMAFWLEQGLVLRLLLTSNFSRNRS